MNGWALLADAVLALHIAVVVFVVGGWMYVVLGYRRDWPGAASWTLRLAHLAAIGFVAVQAWLGQDCPLTVLEMAWRSRAGQVVYGESFIAHWLGRWLYWDVPSWAFTLAYTAFGLAVLLSWWRWPPRRPSTT
jgi:hypothetical protein